MGDLHAEFLNVLNTSKVQDSFLLWPDILTPIHLGSDVTPEHMGDRGFVVWLRLLVVN